MEGRDRVAAAAALEAYAKGRGAEVVHALLALHYDPIYLQSMQRNFSQYKAARSLAPRDHSVQAMTELAGSMLAEA